jgi:hypothetical protein
VSLSYEGARAFSAGNGEEARKLFEQSLQLLAGAGAWEALGHMVLANLAIVQGRFDDGVRACAAGLEIVVGQTRQLDVWWVLGSSARALSGTNELEAAVRLHGAFLAWREARGQEISCCRHSPVNSRNMSPRRSGPRLQIPSSLALRPKGGG